MEKERCFIITPIGNKNDDIRRHINGIIDAVIRPTLQDEYDVIVSHELSELGSINKQIIKEIYNDKLVIANLTTVNPNVMYELAFRHTLGKPVIIIAEEGTKLPFDISVERTIFYNNDALGTIELSNTLKKFIENINFDDISSPIHDTISDISKELKLVDSNENNDEKDLSNLEYILMRLDSIESSVKSLNPRMRFPRASKTRVHFDECPRMIIGEEIFNALSEVKEIDKNVRIDSINIDEESKSIAISETLYDRVSVPAVMRFYIETLENLGFTNVSLRSPNSP